MLARAPPSPLQTLAAAFHDSGVPMYAYSNPLNAVYTAEMKKSRILRSTN